MTQKVEIYTDGYYNSGLKKGGVGVVLCYKEHEKLITFGYTETTNYRMELLAVLYGLKSLTRKNIDLKIYTYSEYVYTRIKNILELNSKEAPDFSKRRNADLWHEFFSIQSDYNIEVEILYDHSHSPNGNYSDSLARKSAKKSINYLIDKGFKG